MLSALEASCRITVPLARFYVSLPCTLWEQYDNVLFDDAGSSDTDGGGEGIRFLYSIMYLIIAMLTTNLFIAIVTQVFPQERERSTQNWDGNITMDLQQIERRKRLEREQKTKNLHYNKSMLFTSSIEVS